MEKMREEFEMALLMKQFPQRCESDLSVTRAEWASDDTGYFQRSTADGKYIWDWVEFAWWGWRSAIERVEV